MTSTTASDGRLTDQIVIVHGDYHALMELTVALSEMRYRVTSAESRTALDTARQLARIDPAAMVVALDGSENVAEMRALLSIGRWTKFVFLVPEMPPHAALARVVNAHGSAILWKEESPVVIAATLVALLAQRTDGAI